MPVTYSLTNIDAPVNGTLLENQFNSDVVRLADGRWLVVWQTNDQHPGGDLFGRIYNVDWTPTAAEFQINAPQGGAQYDLTEPRALATADGGFVAVWADDLGVFYRSFDPTGSAHSESDLLLIPTDESSGISPSQIDVAATADGGFVVTSLRAVAGDFPSDTIGSEVYATFLGGALHATEIKVSTDFAAARASQVVQLANGNFLVSWTAHDSEEDAEVNSGTPMFSILSLNEFNSLVSSTPQMASDAPVEGTPNAQNKDSHGMGEVTALVDGGWVATWTEEVLPLDGSEVEGRRIYQRLYDAVGGMGEAILVAELATEPGVVLATGLQGGPFVAGMADGGWVIVWTSGDAENSQVVGQRYDSAGVADGGQMIFSSRPDGVNIAAGIEADTDGGFTVLFERKDPDGINGFDVYAVTAEFVPEVVVSDPPTVDLDPTEDGTGATASTNENDPAIFIAENVVAADTDDENIESAVISITNAQEHDELRIDASDPLLAGLTVDGNNSSTLFITGPASAATYASIIELVTFYTESGEGERAISVTVSDGDSSSAEAFSLISVTGTDDAPVNVVPAATQTVAAEAALAFSENNENLISTSDEEAEFLTVTLSVANGVLTLGQHTVFMVQFTAGKGSGNAVVEFTGSADFVNDALASLTYKGDAGFTGTDTLTIVTSDGEGPTDTDTVTIEVGEGAEIVRIYNGGVSSDEFTASDDGDWQIYGNGGADQLYGAGGNDFIEGGEGSDSLWGGGGNDIFIVESGNDDAAEGLDQGTADEVRSYADSWTLGDNIEKLILLAGAVTGFGNALANEITGNAAANSLDGRGGADKMSGGDGNDTYAVDHEDDKAIELKSEGYDTVNASVSYSLAFSYLEKLVLTGTGHIAGEGNGLDNLLVGNKGDNILDGSAGHDRLEGNGGDDIMRGGDGNDTFIVTDKDDKVRERAGEGNDVVESSVSFSLAGQHVEELWLTGEAAINGTGNGLANDLYGNDAANKLRGGGGGDFLYGGGGNDLMYGEDGNDVFQILDSGDRAFESSNGTESGYDQVQSAVSYSIAGQYIEGLQLTGSAAINGTGNSQNNFIEGNEGANKLRGDGGDDILFGGGGNDVLHGGAGLDEFRFEGGPVDGNVDRILDFKSADDTIRLGMSYGIEGALGEEAFHKGAAAADESDRVIYNNATGELFFDADGSGEGAQMLFAMVAIGTNLTHADFLGVDFGGA